MRKAIAVRINRWRGYAKQGAIHLPIDRTVISSQIERALTKVFERPEIEAAQRLLQPGDTVLELGAGLGCVSARLRRETRVGRIVCYEANPALVKYIAGAHRANGITDIEVRHGVVLANPTVATMPFYVRSNFASSSLQGGTDDVIATVDVPTVDWATVVAALRPNALVMDIEGAELDLLTAVDMGPIQRLVIELHPGVYGEDGVTRVRSVLAQQGFVAPFAERDVVAFSRADLPMPGSASRS
jgi:FkbM family methyltransferase